MSKINPFAQNVINTLRQETMLQLATYGDPDLDILQKQLDLKDTLDKAVSLMKTSPKGEVSIALLKKHFSKNATALEMLMNSKVKISFYNTDDFSGHLTKSIIFIDPMWSDNFRMFRCSIKLDDSYLKED